MANLDYNHQEFIMQFENLLRNEGFYLKKTFDDTPKGGRFYKNGYKNKAFGRYKFVDGALTTSGNPMIMWALFDVIDKTTGKTISESKTQYFWYEPKEKNNKKAKSPFNEAEYKKIIAEKERKEKELQLALSRKAFEEYRSLKDDKVDPNQHKYLLKKAVPAGRGLIICKNDLRIGSYYNQFKKEQKDKDYFFIRKGDLLIPAINLDLQFVTYQRITDQGVKLQRIDISTVGAFYCLGEWKKSTKRIFLCEGYATGYSLFLATNGVVFVCFDVHNIGVVIGLLKEKYPNIEVVISTDNDRKKTTKVGLYKGFEYSYQYDSPFIFPVFPDEQKYANDSDWNDLSQNMPYSQISSMIESQIKYYYEYGKNTCIQKVASKNGITGDDLKNYAKNNNLLFKTMDLTFV
ncbi:hypothetical protein ACQWTT_001236 [Acinetobacter baumannii]